MLGLTILMLIMLNNAYINAYNAYFNIVIGCKLQQERAGLYGKLKGQFKELGAEIASFFLRYLLICSFKAAKRKHNIKGEEEQYGTDYTMA